jgi:hypothetical protein
MPLIIAHGEPKSGSSFLAQIAFGAARLANGPSTQIRAEIKRHGVITPRFEFSRNITDDFAGKLIAAIPQDLYYVLRTHGSLGAGVAAEIARGKIIAYTSFRDPRDIAISMLDMARRARREGRELWQTELRRASEMIKHVKFGHRHMLEWVGQPNVLALPFYLTSLETNAAIDVLCGHLGLSEHATAMKLQFGPGGEAKRIHHFEKGVPDRFLEGLQPDEVAEIGAALATEIAEIDELNSKWMRRLGFADLLDRLSLQRTQRLAALNVGASAPAGQKNFNGRTHMAKQEKSKSAPAAAAAPQRAKQAPAGGNPENAKRLVAIETNRLMIAALRDVHELVSGKIKEARDQIEQLKKEREGGKSFASYRKLNALRNVRTELSKLSDSLREQMTAKAGAQKAAASQAQGGR